MFDFMLCVSGVVYCRVKVLLNVVVLFLRCCYAYVLYIVAIAFALLMFMFVFACR